MKPYKLLKLIKTRRSIRLFRKSKIGKKQLNMVLEAGRWAPSGRNSQPWRFIVVQNKEKIKTIAKITDYLSGYSNKYIEDAACIIAVIKTDKNPRRYSDIGASIQNILLMAHALGLGACWIGSFDKEKTSEILKIPKNLELAYLIVIGKPNEKPNTNRKPIKKIVSFETY